MITVFRSSRNKNSKQTLRTPMLEFQRKEKLEMECTNQQEEHGGEANTHPSREYASSSHGEESTGFGSLYPRAPKL